MSQREAPGAIGKPAEPRVDVVIPVLNEAHVLAKSVATIREFLQGAVRWDWRIVIVDNGSTDGTDEVGHRLSREFGDVQFVQLPQRGRGRALRHAWTQSDADFVSYTDVDLSTELAALPRLVDALRFEGYDLGTGSRLQAASQTTRSFKREAISRSYNLFVKLVLRHGTPGARRETRLPDQGSPGAVDRGRRQQSQDREDGLGRYQRSVPPALEAVAGDHLALRPTGDGVQAHRLLKRSLHPAGHAWHHSS